MDQSHGPFRLGHDGGSIGAAASITTRTGDRRPRQVAVTTGATTTTTASRRPTTDRPSPRPRHRHGSASSGQRPSVNHDDSDRGSASGRHDGRRQGRATLRPGVTMRKRLAQLATGFGVGHDDDVERGMDGACVVEDTVKNWVLPFIRQATALYRPKASRKALHTR
jgi:hypothetical protein